MSERGWAKFLNLLLAGALLFSCGLAAETKAPALSVSVDPRVELLSIIFRLAGNPEYNQGVVRAYIQDIDRHFSKYRKHPVVQLAKKLRQTRGVAFDAVMDMAVHLTGIDDIQEAIPLNPQPESLDSRWTPDAAREFIALARKFVVQSKFRAFFDGHRSLYRLAVQRMQENLAGYGHLEWFNAFFAERQGSAFRVVLGLVNGGNSYGAHIRLTPEGEDLYSIIGIWETDSQGQPTIPKEIVPALVHEFTHSYTNTLVDRFADQLREAGEKLFSPVAQEMSRQAYGTWQTLMYESLVRACSLRYVLAYEGLAAMIQAAQGEEQRGFYWVGELAAVLGEYDTRVRRYADLADFFPKIIGFFNNYAHDIDSKLAAVKAKKEKALQEMRERGPKIVSLVPANGAKDVDPKLAAIVVTFDRPMRNGSWAVMPLGDEAHFPQGAGAGGYDAQCRVFTIPVKLRPDWEYVLGLNHEQKLGFFSSDGIPLAPVEIRFKTRKK